MKNTKLQILFFILLSNVLTAQVFQCECEDYGQFMVTAESGLVMREQPTTESEIVTVLEIGTEVAGAIEFGNYNPETIQEKESGWRKVFYQNHEGYMFDAFLEKVNMPSLLRGSYMEIGEMEVEGNFLGLFGNSDGFGINSFQLKTMEFAENDGFRDFKIVEDDYPLFVFEGLEINDKTFNGISANNEKLLPGSIQTFYSQGGDYQLITNGTLVTMEDAESEFGPSHKIIDYSITLIKNKDGNRTSQVLFQNQEVHIWDGYYEGAFYIEFMGDLDGDNALDLILTKYSEGGGETFFMLSSKADDGYNLKLIQQMYWGCC